MIDRRHFVKRLFAIGAGFAAGGSLIRQVELLAPGDYIPSLDVAEPGRFSFARMEQAQKAIFAREAEPDLIFWSKQVEEDFVKLLLLDQQNQLSLAARCDDKHAVVGTFTFDRRLTDVQVGQVEDRLFGTGPLTMDTILGQRLLIGARYADGWKA